MDTNTTAIIDKVAPIVDKAMSKRSKQVLENAEACFRARYDYLADTCPCDRIYFGQEDVDKFFAASGISKAEITNALSYAYFWEMKDFNPRAAKDEFTEAVFMCIRYFLKQKGPAAERNALTMSLYLAFSGKFYPSIHYGLWPVSPPSEHRDVMEYVINIQLSNKYDIKKYNSVRGAVTNLVNTWMNYYKDKIIDGTDFDMKDVIGQLHGRIKSFLRNIAEEYYEAYKSGKSMRYLSSNMDNDSGTYRIADSVSQKAERQVEKSVLFITQHNADMSIAAMCADSNVDKFEVHRLAEAIQKDPQNLNLIRELIELTIHEYYAKDDGPKMADRDVTNIDFISWAITPKPNTKNPHLLRIKEITKTLLEKYSERFRKSKRPDTINSYYKSITKYFVLLINKANKI